MAKTCLIVSILLIVGFGVASASAQETCLAPADALAAIQAACGDAPVNSTCTADGAAVMLDESMTANADSQAIRLNGSGDDAILNVYLLGNAALNGYASAPSAQIQISNRAGYNGNLRAGPGSDFEVVGTFRFDDRPFADGRSQDGQWFRVVLADGGIAWVGASLVALDPALEELPVVDSETSTLSGHALTISDGACAEQESAVVIVTHSDSPQRVTINDVPIVVTNGSAYLRLEGALMTFYALAGRVGIGVGNPPLRPGEVVQWAGDLAVPSPASPLPALALFEALPTPPDICLIQPKETSLSLQLLNEPDGTTSGTLDGGVSVPVTQRTTADGADWLHIADDFGGGWLSADQVNTFGACDVLSDPAAISAPDANLTPDQIMMNYLNARVTGDGARMQALACAAYDGQALLQSQAFRAMRAELLDVVCSTVSQNGDSAVVFCTGTIQTEYNGEFRQWELGNYQMQREGGAWRVCGEAN